MTCIKTGCQIYIKPYGIWAYGDAHECGNTYHFRLVSEYSSAKNGALHFEVGNFDSWWDRHEINGKPATLICLKSDCISHGYDGTPINPATSLPEIWE